MGGRALPHRIVVQMNHGPGSGHWRLPTRRNRGRLRNERKLPFLMLTLVIDEPVVYVSQIIDGRQSVAIVPIDCSFFAPSPNSAKVIALKIDDLPEPVGP